MKNGRMLLIEISFLDSNKWNHLTEWKQITSVNWMINTKNICLELFNCMKIELLVIAIIEII